MRSLFITIKLWIIILLVVPACNTSTHHKSTSMASTDKIILSETEWAEKLTEEQFNVLRLKATEKPFSGKYYQVNDKGIYCCAACGNELFSSETKFDAGCGWPSFYDAIAEDKIETRQDTSFNMNRTEIMCARCGGHLGHLFDDGPAPTGKRYCVNSVSLGFIKK
ncbi:MAG TPA: peptide-methionine (R)-S-oxide reductase MsrB [Bacteroidales bacterium]|nr:peptide-methionine (R)-S-oxide reductase MsrB [Bacteroidales bacterium]